MHGIVPRPTAQKFMTPSCHGDHAYSVGRVFLLCNSRQHTGQRASASVEFETKRKMEEKRQVGKRALTFPFVPKWGDYSVGLVPLNLEKAGPFLEGYCLMSLRFKRKYLLVDLLFLPCLHTSQSSPLWL